MNGQQELNDALQRVVRPSQNYYDKIFKFAKRWAQNQELPRFTTEQLRIYYEVSSNKLPDEPRVYGAVIKQLQKEGKIRHVGYTKATNKQAHCRPISVWEVV